MPPAPQATVVMGAGAVVERQLLDVRGYGVAADGTTDDTAALTAAIEAANARAADGLAVLLALPVGRCRITSALPAFEGPVGLVGAGHLKSVILVDPAYVGDVFAWTECWMGGASSPWPPEGDTVDLDTSTAGVIVSGLSVVGDRSAAEQQHAFTFYERNDQVHFFDVDVFYLRGRAFYAGAPGVGSPTPTQAYMRESRLERLRFYNCGDVDTPVFEIRAQGFGDASNEIDIGDVDIFAPYGPGFVIRNENTVKGISDIRISKLRIEGYQPTASPTETIAADLMVIGDPAAAGNVNTIFADQLYLLNPYVDQAALRLAASASDVQPYHIVARGFIGGGAPAGKGLVIDAGRACKFFFSDINTEQTNVTIAASPMVGRGITIEGDGEEQNWTYDIDGSFTGAHRSGYVARHLDPTSGGFVAAAAPDGTAVGGDTRGGNAVDLQLSRIAASQVASGQQSVVGGGQQNSATVGWSTVPGGWSCVADGLYSLAGGRQGRARGRYATRVHGNSFGVAGGDAQISSTILKATATGTSAVRLTGDAGAAGAANVCNIPNNAAYAFRVTLHARNFDTPGTDYSWHLPAGMVTRDASAATTAVSIGTPVELTRGTVTGAGVSLTADTTNGGLDLEFTPPDGNTDTWHVVAVVEAAEVQ